MTPRQAVVMRWLGEYAVACAIATCALVLTFITGFAAGALSGPGANAAVAQGYAQGLQAQWDAQAQIRVGDAQRECAETTNKLSHQLSELEIREAAAEIASAERLDQTTRVASERILGLQRQLQQHGIAERIVSVKATQ